MTRDWRPGRRSQPRPSEYTPWTLSLLSPSAEQGKRRTERPGSCLVASPRLVPFLLDLGKLPKLDLGVLANNEHPGSSPAGQIVQHSRFTPSGSRTITHDPCTEQSSHTHTSPHLISRHPWAFLPQLCLLSRLTSSQSITAQLLSGLLPKPCQPARGTESLIGTRTRPDWLGFESSTE